jgi:hypothetical protein
MKSSILSGTASICSMQMEAFFASAADLLAGLVRSHDQKRSQLQKEGTQFFSFHSMFKFFKLGA